MGRKAITLENELANSLLAYYLIAKKSIIFWTQDKRDEYLRLGFSAERLKEEDELNPVIYMRWNLFWEKQAVEKMSDDEKQKLLAKIVHDFDAIKDPEK